MREKKEILEKGNVIKSRKGNEACRKVHVSIVKHAKRHQNLEVSPIFFYNLGEG